MVADSSLGEGIRSSKELVDFEALYNNNKADLNIRKTPLSIGWHITNIFATTAAAAVALPIIALTIPAIAIDNRMRGIKKNPIFFLQERVGHKGKTFKVIKFCSMLKDAAAANTDASSNAGKDPRINGKLGEFMRKAHIDEMPQILNVFMGQMRVVGCRPHPIGYASTYQEIDNDYLQRLTEKPGILGLQQNTFDDMYNYKQTVPLGVKLDKFFTNNINHPLNNITIPLKTFSKLITSISRPILKIEPTPATYQYVQNEVNDIIEKPFGKTLTSTAIKTTASQAFLKLPEYISTNPRLPSTHGLTLHYVAKAFSPRAPQQSANQP